MPMMPVYITMTSTGTTRAVNLDYNSKTPFNVTVAAVFGSTTMTAQYSVEYTYDDPLYLSLIGSTKSQVWQYDPVIGSSATSALSVDYAAPVAAVRMTLTAISSSNVTFTVIPS